MILSDYKDVKWNKTLLDIEGYGTMWGFSYDGRVDTATIPENYYYYFLRHSDDDWTEIASIKNGDIMVNFYGVFITDTPIPFTKLNDEWEVKDYRIEID